MYLLQQMRPQKKKSSNIAVAARLLLPTPTVP